MRSPAELDLVRRDAGLPGLGLLFDSPALLAALRTLSGSARLQACQLRYLRYKPGRNCLAAYTLTVAGRDWPMYAKAHAADAPGKLTKSAQRSVGSSPLGPGRLLLPQAQMEFCLFPQDNKLPSLTQWTDSAWRTGFLSRKRPDWSVPESASWRTLAYKPERRWVAALDLGSGRKGVLRLHSAETFAAAQPQLPAPCSGEILRVAAPSLLSRSHQAIWSDWQEGSPLATDLNTRTNDTCWDLVGQALGEFHAQTGAGPLDPSASDPMSTLASTRQLLGHLLPRTQSRLHELCDVLRRTPPHCSVPLVRLHGDFSASQVVLSPHGTVALLDLDESRLGAAAVDLGSFLAALDLEVIRGRLSSRRVEEVRDELLHGYARRRPALKLQDVEFHRSIALFHRLPEFFRSGESDWPQLTHTGLEILGSRCPLASPSRWNTAPRCPVSDPALPHLDTALCCVSMAPLLTEALAQTDAPGATGGLFLESAALRRHKTGRRALIEYRLRVAHRSGDGPVVRVLGKLRRRGLDDSNLELLQRLGQGAFQRHSADGSSIPAVLGTVPRLGLWLQELVPGTALSEVLNTPLAHPAIRRTAEALHKLHRQTLPLRRTHTSRDELEILEIHLREVADQRPDWRPRLTWIWDECQRLVASLPAAPSAPVHRDFYHDQVLIEGEHLWLVDFDLLCAGNPALDVGNFAGHLLELALREPSQRCHLESLAEAFLQRYQELAPSVSRFLLDAYTTLTLVRHISLSTRFEARRPFTARLLELCEQRLGRETSRTPHHRRTATLSIPCSVLSLP
ncbi:MAG: hypothetical protein J0M24_25180 [Verrucomicrobia bacterium]|nr:hypothetical protein [Verrucomicrobiota bacterium]